MHKRVLVPPKFSRSISSGPFKDFLLPSALRLEATEILIGLGQLTNTGLISFAFLYVPFLFYFKSKTTAQRWSKVLIQNTERFSSSKFLSPWGLTANFKDADQLSNPGERCGQLTYFQFLSFAGHRLYFCEITQICRSVGVRVRTHTLWENNTIGLVKLYSKNLNSLLKIQRRV